MNITEATSYVDQAIQSESTCACSNSACETVCRQRWFPNGASGFSGGSSVVGGTSDVNLPVVTLTAASVDLKATEQPNHTEVVDPVESCRTQGCGML